MGQGGEVLRCQAGLTTAVSRIARAPHGDIRGLVLMHIRKTFFGAVAAIAAVIGPAGAQANPQGEPSHPLITVYVQASDARFDSYFYVKKNMSPNKRLESSDEFFFIPRSNSKEREKEFADWRRKFGLIVSAATLSESVQPKISHVKEEFGRATHAAECWAEDKNKERRITITIIGSADQNLIENEYKTASRDFFANPKNFMCTYKLGPSASEP
jgi:hypothetical protein